MKKKIIKKRKPVKRKAVKKDIKSPVLYEFKKNLNTLLESVHKAELIISSSDALKIYNALSKIGIESHFK